MGARGPKAKPLEQRRRTGRSPGRDSGGRALPAPVTLLPGVSGIPDVPDELRTTDNAESCILARGSGKPCELCLAELGVKAWARLWAAASSWLSVGDADVMIRICQARITEAHFRLALKEDGWWTAGQRGGLVSHPAAAQLNALLDRVVKDESLCGLNPSARGSLGVAEVKPGGQDDIVARRTAPRVTAPVPGRAAPRPRAVGSGQD
jgi:phage terminase small subunit